ncbi:hypothetical protein M408DRAFT_29400 [Serendipita vermifera MAFF 305830]|uniref:Uncharacterized protein n=1 Tax=Serendipita vermifera MAFF 305830 TaxID=933852 RepID=A0A0C2WWB0_SERVB|nr:hypothetical protein M408DRAFT_29400 [Serendipita vermifera MAFF 305830]
MLGPYLSERSRVLSAQRIHGFFVIMGGFHLFRLPAHAASIPLILRSSKTSKFVIPSGLHLRIDEIPVRPLKFDDIPVDILQIMAPTETELRDKSKSDTLAKFIVLVQTSWFMIQCIARGTQNLPLTQLEVVTLAYAMLNFFIYAFWWAKPQNVDCPVRLYAASRTSHHKSGEAVEWEENRIARWMEKIAEYTVGEQDRFATLSDQRSIPMFWSGRPCNRLLVNAGTWPSILGSAFVPLIVAILCTWWSVDGKAEGKFLHWMWVIAAACVVLLMLSAWLYIISRIATLVIAFTTLRYLPPAAFDTVDWTNFIPHI